MKLQAPKGTKDIHYDDVRIWQYIEEVAKKTFENANFSEIRTPIFESTKLFKRGVGESTDIVNKEMYTFEQKERSFTLRPENTAGVVRSFIQEGLFKKQSPQKLWYKGPMFRYERPQAGRQRQFHQIGVEMFGINTANADAEVILLAMNFFKELEIPNLKLYLNSIGCPECRNDYKNKIKDSLKDNLENLCGDCQRRYHTNPLRILDCKVEKCQEITSQEHILKIINSDFICECCSTNFTELKSILKISNVDYQLNKKLVRGLDYYNGTVFEIISDSLGAQNTVCGGGRYDGLVDLLGGPKTPAVGWALGVERLISILNKNIPNVVDVFIITDQYGHSLNLASKLREQNIKTEINFSKAKFGKQFDKAIKLGAKFAVTLGKEEIENNVFTIKDLRDSSQLQLNKKDLIEHILSNR